MVATNEGTEASFLVSHNNYVPILYLTLKSIVANLPENPGFYSFSGFTYLPIEYPRCGPDLFT